MGIVKFFIVRHWVVIQGRALTVVVRPRFGSPMVSIEFAPGFANRVLVACDQQCCLVPPIAFCNLWFILAGGHANTSNALKCSLFVASGIGLFAVAGCFSDVGRHLTS